MSDDTRYLYTGLWISVLLLYLLGRVQLVPPYFSLANPISLGSFALINVLFAGVLLSLRKNTNKALETAMVTDPQSLMYNSAHFYSTVEAEIDRSKRRDYTFSIIYSDIDYFHRYNEENGMKAGDDVLAHMGEMLAGMTRKYDIGFRFGNDEFVVLLPETDKVQARFIAERIGEAFGRAYEGSLSLSIGIAQWIEGDTVDSLLRKAEESMNDARRGGGNLIRTHIDRGQV